jgi:hypothetical protein
MSHVSLLLDLVAMGPALQCVPQPQDDVTAPDPLGQTPYGEPGQDTRSGHRVVFPTEAIPSIVAEVFVLQASIRCPAFPRGWLGPALRSEDTAGIWGCYPFHYPKPDTVLKLKESVLLTNSLDTAKRTCGRRTQFV